MLPRKWTWFSSYAGGTCALQTDFQIQKMMEIAIHSSTTIGALKQANKQESRYRRLNYRRGMHQLLQIFYDKNAPRNNGSCATFPPSWFSSMQHYYLQRLGIPPHRSFVGYNIYAPSSSCSLQHLGKVLPINSYCIVLTNFISHKKGLSKVYDDTTREYFVAKDIKQCAMVCWKYVNTTHKILKHLNLLYQSKKNSIQTHNWNLSITISSVKRMMWTKFSSLLSWVILTTKQSEMQSIPRLHT